MILDLGYDVTGLEILQDIQGVGSNLKLGYAKANTNTDFGVDSFITELYFGTPATNIPQDMNFEDTGIVCDQYEKEKARAQHVNQPVGTVFDPANPSSDNQAYALYCCPAPVSFELPHSPDYPFSFYDPDNNPVPIYPTRVLMYNGIAVPGIAQSSDPTAATQPYVKGLYYPNAAQNIPLSPCRALDRDTGALVHSYLDKMDADYIAFRRTGIMQFNNVVLNLSGIESNLKVGAAAAPIVEMSDKLISTLPDKLTLSTIIKVTSTSAQNLFNQLNTNPNGYIRFWWKNDGFGYTEYRFFMNKAKQIATPDRNIATQFEGNAVPSGGGYVSPV